MINYLRDVEALALNIYHEARGESDAGKIAVALATRNRVEDSRWPDSYFDVVWQKKQFSWTNEITENIPSDVDRLFALESAQQHEIEAIKEEEVFKKCLEIAAAVARGSVEDYVDGANHYHTKAVNPSWNKDMELTAVIGEHEFYKG